MIDLTYTANEALRSAMEYAQLATEDVRVAKLAAKDGLYEITLHTPYQMYEFYVDAATGEVLGINAVPSLDLESAYEDGDRDAALRLIA